MCWKRLLPEPAPVTNGCVGSIWIAGRVPGWRALAAWTALGARNQQHARRVRGGRCRRHDQGFGLATRRGGRRLAQRLDEGGAVREAPIGLLRQAAKQRLGSRRGDGRVEDVRRWRRLVNVLQHRRVGRVGHKRRPPGEQLVGHHGERVLIDTSVDRVAAYQFRRHVCRRADACSGLRQRFAGATRSSIRLQQVRQTEVNDDRRAIFGQEDVARLHVAVNDAAAVREVERGGDGAEQPHHLVQRLRQGKPLQRTAGDVAVDDERLLALFAEVEDRQDVGVFEPRQHPRLAAEAGTELRPPLRCGAMTLSATSRCRLG